MKLNPLLPTKTNKPSDNFLGRNLKQSKPGQNGIKLTFTSFINTVRWKRTVNPNDFPLTAIFCIPLALSCEKEKKKKIKKMRRCVLMYLVQILHTTSLHSLYFTQVNHILVHSNTPIFVPHTSASFSRSYRQASLPGPAGALAHRSAA